MATVKVSSSSALQNALKSAGSNTTIELTSGTYSINIKNSDFKGAVIKEASGANVTFSSVELRNASHLTFDGVSFKLPNTKKGVVIADSSDITIKGSDLSGSTAQGTVGVFINKSNNIAFDNNDLNGFATALKLSNISGLSVKGNDFTGTSWDALIAGAIHNATISGNHISLNTPGGRKHTDGMQFYNNKGNSPLSDVTISNNVIETHNQSSHGIYFANSAAMDGGGTSTYAKNLVISGNTIVSAQVSGIAVGQTVKLTIKDNVILQDTAHKSTKMIDIPVIRVHQDSTGVSITGNTTHKIPEASGVNWQPTGKAESAWTISNNKIVPLGTKAGNVAKAAAEAPTETAAATKEIVSVAAAATLGDVFRFDAKGPADKVKGIDFAGGDQLVLHDYAKGTFKAGDIADGGSTVTIDHLDDLKALAKASADVHVREGKGDTLVIDIDQPGGDHIVKLIGMADAYFA